MKDSDFVDLANRVIDGVGSEHDRAALEAVLRDSTQRRLEYEQLSAVASILDAVRPIDPPDDLRDKILAGIPRSPASVAPQSWLSSTFASILEALSRKPVTGFSYAVAAGLVVGVALMIALPQVSIDDGNVVGTMSALDSESVFSQVDQAEIHEGDALRAQFALETAKGVFRVRLDLTAQEAYDVRASLTPNENTWRGVVMEEGAGSIVASLAGGDLHLQELREGSYSLIGRLAATTTGDVKVTLLANDGQDHIVTMQLSPAEN